MKLTQDVLEDDLVFVLHQAGGTMSREQASALLYFLHKKTFAQPYWQELHGDGTPRWQKFIDFARLRAVKHRLVAPPGRSNKAGVWRLTEEGRRRAQAATDEVAKRSA